MPVATPQPAILDSPPLKVNHLTSHPTLLQVHHKPGTDQSWVCLLTKGGIKAGQTVAKFEGLTRGVKAYSSVQIGPLPEDHVELNSSLLYLNHSCRPNCAFVISTSIPQDEWEVRALTDLEEGEVLTFFYPSTEWEMDRAFACRCNEPQCLQMIQGASKIPRDILGRQLYISPHILALKEEQDKA